MQSTERIEKAIELQREALVALEAERRAIAGSDIVRENAALKAEAENLRTALKKADAATAALSAENAGLKNALAEQMFTERSKLLENAARKLDIYFCAQTYGELNRLTALEQRVKARVNRLRESLARSRIDAENELYGHLNALTALTDKRLTEARSAAATVSAPDGGTMPGGIHTGGTQPGGTMPGGIHTGGTQPGGTIPGGSLPGSTLTVDERVTLTKMNAEPLSDLQVRASAKKNSLERLVGLNILNVAGILLLLIGAIALARFTYSYLDDILKGIILFTLGAVMLVAGELLNRKAVPNVFSLGVSAGGIAILYAALAASYFGLRILSMIPAIVICVLITASAFVLSSRYRSQTIASFALIGGYLPMLAVSGDIAVTYGSMVWFIVLNILALLLSYRERWRISSFLGLTLNILGTIYICTVFADTGDSLSKRILIILFVLFTFLVYTAIPLMSGFRTRVEISDIVMLGINTFFSSITVYGVFLTYELGEYNGLLAVVFAAVYLALGRFAEMRQGDKNRHVRVLFYLTGLAFVVLAVPLQFGRVWLSLGWLAEGVLLAVYGILREERRFRRAGFVISGLCLVAFVCVDMLRLGGLFSPSHLFSWKYLAITVGSLTILGAYMRMGMMTGGFVSRFKYFVLVNLWFYGQFLLMTELSPILDGISGGVLGGVSGRISGWYGVFDINYYNYGYLIGAAMVALTFALAWIYPRIPLLAGRGVRILSTVLHIAGIVMLALVNASDTPLAATFYDTESSPLGVVIVGTLVLAILGICSILALFDVMRTLTVQRRVKPEHVPLVISGYFILSLTQNLIVQYGLAFSSAVLSIIYVLTALGWIVLGFYKRYSMLRRFGLCLAILAVVKLFLVDLHTQTLGYRVVTYFALGVTLIAISFVYQRFSKRLELREGVIADAGKNEER